MSLAVLAPLILGPAAFAWQTGTAVDLGFEAAALDAVGAEALARRADALVVIRRDRVVLEVYADGFDRRRPHGTASLAKALVGGLTLALAIDDGLAAPGDPASRWIGAWRDDPRKARITLAQLAGHSSGLADARHVDTGWEADFWDRDGDPFTVSRDIAPLEFAPGERLGYSNPGLAMLGYAVTAATGRDLRGLLAERIMRPLGLPDQNAWGISYGREWQVDGLTLCANWGGASYSPDAVARVGRLVLRRGDWDGRRLLSPAVVDTMIGDAGAPTPARDDPIEGPRPRSALGWWHNGDGALAGVPRDAVIGAGAGQQILAVIPSLELIIVRFGQQMPGTSFWGGVADHLLRPIVAAVRDDHPAERIGGVEFAPPETIRRAALGSDNWPTCWTADGEQLTSYGDGWGFEPRRAEKLSRGLARLLGGPTDYRAENLPSAEFDRPGDGPAGPKISGLLEVDGTVYALARNTGNTTLLQSADGGRSWTAGWRWTESFGCPAFGGAGPGYAGAPDAFVYVVSVDRDDAYSVGDRLVLARAPRGEVAAHEAWRYYAGRRGGEPIWSADIAERAAVLSRHGACQRTDLVWNAPLRCWLLTLGHDHAGGWSLHAAAEPWGPWREVFATDWWDQGETHGYRLPARWIGPDGRDLWLIFSGRDTPGLTVDAFCLRAMRLLEPR